MPTSATDLEVVTDHDLELFFMIEELEEVGCEHTEHTVKYYHGGAVRRAIKFRTPCCARAAQFSHIKWVCDGFWEYINVAVVVCAGCSRVFSQKDHEVVMTREV